MPGHQLTLRVKTKFSHLFKLLIANFGGIYLDYYQMEDNRRIGFILGEKFFFRTSSYAGIAIIVKEESPEICIVDVIAFAGGSGIFNISYHSHPDYAREVLIKLKENKIPVELVKEVAYLTSEKLPNEIREKLSWLD